MSNAGFRNDPRRFINEDYKVLSDPNSSQKERRQALKNLEAKRGKKNLNENIRQRPLSAYSNAQQGLHATVDPSRPTIEDEMRQQTDSAHGYEVFSPGFQQFSSHEVRVNPNAIRRNGNRSNFGYASEPNSPSYLSLTPNLSPSAVLAQAMKVEDTNVVGQIVSALKRQATAQNLRPHTVFERWERTTPDASQETLYLVAQRMNVISERYDSTAGEWVVTMPWKDPQSPEEILYNQRGLSNSTAEQLEKRQVGNYYINPEATKTRMTAKVLPPAKENQEGTRVPYHSKNPKSMESLKNAKRADDFIRNARVKAAAMEEEAKELKSAYEKTKDRFVKNKISRRAKEVMAEHRSIISQIQQVEKEQRSAEQAERAMNVYAEQLSGFFHPDGKSREQNTYNRHLSLLDEAKRVISHQNGDFIGRQGRF